MFRLSRIRRLFSKLGLAGFQQDRWFTGRIGERCSARLRVEPLEDRCLLARSAIGPAPQQQSGGPVTGRISALAIANTHVQQAPTLFLGAAGGGIWTSVTFTGNSPSYGPAADNFSITDPNSGLGAGAIDVGSIAVDPNDLIGTIYVGTGEANYSSDSRYGTGILKSTDGGNTFRLIATGTAAHPQAFFRHAISKIIIDPNNSRNLYAAVVGVLVNGGDTADNGVYKSTDAGATWVKTTGGNLGGPQIGDGVTVTDMEYTWNRAANSLALYAGVQSITNDPRTDVGGIWQSTDGGVNWAHIGVNNVGSIITVGGLPFDPSDVRRVAFAADHTSGATSAYAAIIKRDGTVLDVVKAISNDGRSWRGMAPGNFTGNQGWYDVAIGLSPTNRLYVAGKDKIFESPDLATWTDITNAQGGPPHALALQPG